MHAGAMVKIGGVERFVTLEYDRERREWRALWELYGECGDLPPQEFTATGRTQRECIDALKRERGRADE